MPQRLHRLEVRQQIVSILAPHHIDPRLIVSREAGYIDVFVTSGHNGETIRDAVMDGLIGYGVVVACVQATFQRRQRKWMYRFQNDLMLQQAQWGARGMSRGYRVRNGIDAEAGPQDVGLVRSGAQPTIHPRGENPDTARQRAHREEYNQWLANRIEQRTRAATMAMTEEFGLTPPTVEPLTEEQQDEEDSGILTRVRVSSVALEESERG